MDNQVIPKVLYIRSGPYEINFNNYNLQEVGLGKAFCKAGYDFDIVYYAKENRDQVIDVPMNNLRILWRKGFKILRTGIYPSILEKDFTSKYDVIITSEYSQLMTVFLLKRHCNVYLYNGPYYNLFKLPFLEPVYDKLFCKKINRDIKKTFCKTEMAKIYIAQKGIVNSTVTGVGLDSAKFDNEIKIKDETAQLLKKMSGQRNFLYVGNIIKRKNVELILAAFVKLKQLDDYKDVQLILIGKGDRKYIEYCHGLVPDCLKESIVWYDFIENAQMKFIYSKAIAFLLPSIQEIFGMVLLEAMYFEIPVISSYSAGAGTLIKNNKNGIIIKEFDSEKWCIEMIRILSQPEKAERLGHNAGKTIRTNFMWDVIAKKMIAFIKS